MTKEEFNNLKEGDFVTDMFNGFNRVYYVGTDFEGERYFSCVYVEYDVEANEWNEVGASWDVTEYNALNEDNGRGMKRWEILTVDEVKGIENDYREDWEKFEAEWKKEHKN
ncbi:MAG: hypothetical protein J6S49_08005 [Erysipelotrichaceae bacterium]|nr:hypothetical protein [Erysipelotrichaceae bacterium]